MAKKLLNWAKQALLLLVVAIVLSGALDWWRSKDIDRTNLPPLVGTSLKKMPIDLASLSQDQAVLVYFWGTWCHVCNYVTPAVNSMATHYPTITVALGSGDDNRMNQYLYHHEYQFTVLNDPNNSLGQLWKVSVTPTILVIKNNQVEYFTTGFTSLPGLWWRMLTA
ncbi:protein disulfide oxidoreductase [Motilimonas sp. 1_MG-2023]|uniref:protein disulfide oxidoreductase n=1 Tax=Motilimonas sp. 1_MG-2023 TaxID=3062672 RepID=UPI0026E21B46|nr:protein disulfide oxidoreductase [Motilimonas sp. 1_MG-2023]MDO6527464.1 protein disulfide oxidoreductase [Motilimonas sp. 1_MG-2023]